MIKMHILALALGFIIDLIIGDPKIIPHPIRGMGKTIAWTEKKARQEVRQEVRKVALGRQLQNKGIIITLINCIIWLYIPIIILVLTYFINPILGFAAECFMDSQLLATKSLRSESMKVYRQLKLGNIIEARKAVSMIVGRDTKELDETGITKATIETVAENLSDGVIAPMVYISLGGPVLGYLYKVINTMDSMIGYKDEKFIDLGRFSAKLDDVVNFMPARISAVMMLISAPLIKLNVINALKIYKRDRKNHASPNSAQTESVAAGALEIKLAGDAYYFGKLYKKPFIGDDIKQIIFEDIKKMNNYMYITAILSIIILIILAEYGRV